MIYSLIFLFFLMGYGSTGVAYTNEDCLGCHTGSGSAEKIMDLEEFNSSIHSENDVGCSDCHTAITDDSHEKAGWKPENETLLSDCFQCHDIENRHGVQGQNSPKCHDCHTQHGILPASDAHSSVHTANLDKTCAGCHPRPTGQIKALSFLPSLKISTHEKQDFSQDRNDKNCIGCHQGYAVHGTDAPVNDKNCRTCHFNADNTPALWGTMHPDAAKEPKTMAAGIIQLIFLCGVVVVFFTLGRTEK